MHRKTVRQVAGESVMTTQTRGTQTKETNTTPTSRPNDHSGSPSQAGMQMTQGDRERPVESTRERGRTSGTNVQRQSITAPARASITTPFTMMRRMAEEMDRLFDQFGVPRTGPALMPR